jgi:hypothetical protein
MLRPIITAGLDGGQVGEHAVGHDAVDVRLGHGDRQLLAGGLVGLLVHEQVAVTQVARGLLHRVERLDRQVSTGSSARARSQMPSMNGG